MKKLLMMMAILGMMTTAAYSYTTPRLGLSTPTIGGFDYTTIYPADMLIIDSSVAVQGLFNNFTASQTFSSPTYHTAGLSVSTITFTKDGSIMTSTSGFVAGTIGSSGQMIFNNSGVIAGTSDITVNGATITVAGAGGLQITNLSANNFVGTNGNKQLITQAITSANLPPDVMYNDQWQKVTSSITFSSYTTVSNLTANKCVATDSNDVLISSGICGSSGGDGSGSVYGSYNGTSSALFIADSSGHVPTATTSMTQDFGVGVNALLDLSTGQNNAAGGFDSLSSLTNGFYNSAFGNQTLQESTVAYSNTAFGNSAGYWISGSSNTLMGSYAGPYNNSTYSYGVLDSFFGFDSGNNEYGSSDTYIGSNAGPTNTPSKLVNSIAIGYNAVVNSSNTTVIGNTSTSSTTIYGLTNFPQGLSGGMRIKQIVPFSTTVTSNSLTTTFIPSHFTGTITPLSAGDTIYIYASVSVGVVATVNAGVAESADLKFLRGTSTALTDGNIFYNASGFDSQVTSQKFSTAANVSLMDYDFPNTTSAITYTLYFECDNGVGEIQTPDGFSGAGGLSSGFLIEVGN